MIQQKKLHRCADCGKLRPSRMMVIVDGEELHHCAECWEGHRRKFVEALAAQQPRAVRIYNAVIAAVELLTKPKTDD